MKPLRLLQLNIERDKHLDRVCSFLDHESFDVICLQETFERDAHMLAERYNLSLHFTPRVLRNGAAEGVAILSPHPLKQKRSIRYAGQETLIEGILQGTMDEKTGSQMYLVAFADVTLPTGHLTIGTTHFPWTPDGGASDFQRKTMFTLLELLASESNFILCGDFNAPRGGEIWEMLAAHYCDNIPTTYTSSIDPELHRAAPLELMVDGIFSTPGYKVSNVLRVCGLSDHCGFTGEIFHAT